MKPATPIAGFVSVPSGRRLLTRPMRRWELEQLRLELEHAGQVLSAVQAALCDAEISDAGQEMARRRLERGARAIESLMVEVVARIRALRLVVGLGVCPQCGWARRYEKDDRCPRCNALRAARPPPEEGSPGLARAGRR